MVTRHPDQLGSVHLDRRPDGADLPEYTERLLALHRAHWTELGEIVDHLPLSEGQRVIDVATGDGTFAQLLADRQVWVWALDENVRYLELARARLGSRTDVVFEEGDALHMPYEDGHFDGAFCAQSLYSLPDANRALHEMQRVVQPGGWVAVLENDTLHRVILPWPAELELAIRTAELEWFKRQPDDKTTHYVGRRLAAELEELGLVDVQNISFSTERSAPISRDERTFLLGFLRELEERVGKILHRGELRRFKRLCDPDDPEFLLEQPGFTVTYLDFLCIGTKPTNGQSSRVSESTL